MSATAIPMAARSKAYVCGRLVARIADSNPARGMDIRLFCLYVVLSCLCDGLITHPDESYPERGPVFQMGTTGKLINDYH
jgi:hypothetical protein